jgi:hypothetical protein
MELLKSVDGALICIVEKEATDHVLDEVGHGFRDLNQLHESQGDGGVEPGHNTLINLKPLCIVSRGLGINGAVNVIENAKLAKGGAKDGSPGREGCVSVV